MKRIKIGDVVARISYNKDVIFEVKNIIRINRNKNKNNNNNNNKNNELENIYILKGLTKRIEADSPLDDLELLDKRIININIKNEELKVFKRIKASINKEYNKRNRKYIYTGKILHLDGDKRYSQKSINYYKKLGLNAIVKNIPENKQASVIITLLDRYNPDILIITGHDGMIKNGYNYNDIYNYRNSRYFVNTVNQARKWSKSNKLSIFAGACQSFYEAIMSAGANFASSPKRIMIDFLDPLVVAQRIATTENTKYITINDIKDELRDGRDGIDGIGSIGKSYTKNITL